MPMPTDIPIIDLMLGIPSEEAKRSYDFMRPLFRDAESLKSFDFPVEYMFKDVPVFSDLGDRIKYVLDEMDKYNIERALIGVSLSDEVAQRAMREHPDRFIASCNSDPNRGVDDLRDIVRLHEEFDVRAVSAFPAGYVPQVPIGDKRFYPVYAKCVELDIPIFTCVGVPGPRIPMACQKVELIDEVMWFFPELKFVMRHGAEPWEDLAVKLMLKWPNLYYSTSAFAPRYYPKAIVDYANTRGADKVLYAGYFPMGLSLERIFKDMPDVPFRDHVWPKFLRGNALRLLKLDE
ncbi:MAG: putative TIM-barrel fold metal-dependent hydrolase [Myxococcota bacterium]|jgi:predicted TIM-barrel fold metal-dependent hydrolase